MNKAFIQPGPPKSKLDAGPISDLKRGVPVSVVAEKNGLSRGTVYRIIKDHPELAKEWEDRKKKKQPEPAPIPAPDPAPARPTTARLADELFQFLASHEPELASTTTPVVLQRMALETLLSNLGLVTEDDFDGMSEEELVARVTAYQSKDKSQQDAVRKDAVESPPSPGDGVEGVRMDETARTATSPQAVLDEFLARHRPAIASSKTIHSAAKRMALLVAMVEAGLGDPDDLDLLDDEALATKIAESEHQGQADGSRV